MHDAHLYDRWLRALSKGARRGFLRLEELAKTLAGHLAQPPMALIQDTWEGASRNLWVLTFPPKSQPFPLLFAKL